MSKLWGGRFSKKTNPLVEEFTKSIHYDQKLAEYDCLGSLVHISVLKKAKLLTSAEYQKLKKGLESILKEIQLKTLKISQSHEDIHSFIQGILEEKIGKTALKLHTCRSRNDQIVYDMKCFCFDSLIDTDQSIDIVIKNLSSAAKKNSKTYIPGYTHLQHAIPVRLSDHLTAYAHMLKQDKRRLKSVLDNLNITMGSGALAGTFIDSKHYSNVTKLLAKGSKTTVKAVENSIYTVSDRDFIIETLSALSMLGMHLSRLAEDLILWASKEFNFIDIDDAFCTGSSLMPQKKNPDVLELIRGYTGTLYGNLMSVLVMMKGLPLSYNRDMQLDKEPLFDSLKIVNDSLNVLAELLKGVKFKKENIAKQLDDESLYATDISDYLVKQKVPFKDAHSIIGKLIAFKDKKELKLIELDAKTLKTFHPKLTPAVIKRIINPKTSVLSKKSIKRKKL